MKTPPSTCPPKEVFHSDNGKTVINITTKVLHSSQGIQIEITNAGAIKVNNFEAFYEFVSAQELQKNLQVSLNALLEKSLPQSKLPFFTRIFVLMREGITSSHSLVDSTDIDSRNLSEIYCFTNKKEQHKAIFHRTQGSASSRELESKTFPFAGLIAISKGLDKLLKYELTSDDH